jgi:ketopantoate reductase
VAGRADEEAVKILVFGAGVIGVAYAWQLSLAGHDVALLVRPGRGQELTSEGIAIYCLDVRGSSLLMSRGAKRINAVYHPTVVESFSPDDHYELILVCVRRNQLGDALPTLAANAGDATILFLQNNWTGVKEIEPFMTPSHYLLGFPSVGGARDQHGVKCVLLADTRLGEVDGRVTPRLERIAEAMRRAGFKPKITREIVPWLQVHCAGVAAFTGCYYKAGSYEALSQSSSLIREMILAIRESMEICRARGIKSKDRSSSLPLFLLVPLTKRVFRSELGRLGTEGHMGHATDEVRFIYFEVLAEGERLGVNMPYFKGFEEYVRKGVLRIAAI